MPKLLVCVVGLITLLLFAFVGTLPALVLLALSGEPHWLHVYVSTYVATCVCTLVVVLND